ncbi:proton-coupled thiamine transporter [Lacticaseibacillus thailandensis DSM 22698 = JCM 13996]|uniref:Proton-coupled thiamine transporter n=2 Tax=Lacticaseibacillus thailandensis TaxID=381741 RepID=A0A0R2C816_9LACO|nr:proton-coupled thiamine transporter [Lacticaseibacillus thailandensis DSM 22698 = JCM 13996]
MVEVAVMAAVATALHVIPHTTGVSAIELEWGMIPIVVLALRRGMGPAMMGGLIWGVLDMILFGLASGSVLNPIQGVVEYPIAFTCAGLAGVAYRAFQQGGPGRRRLALVAAVCVGTCAKYFWHFIAGWIFWGSYAPHGQAAWLYSLVINGGSAVVTMVATLIAVILVDRLAPQLLRKP